jgi:hypothetical protein
MAVQHKLPPGWWIDIDQVARRVIALAKVSGLRVILFAGITHLYHIPPPPLRRHVHIENGVLFLILPNLPID